MRRTYDEVTAALAAAVRVGIHPSLDGIRQLTAELGEPHRRFMSVQVGGTNGKTSTSRYTEAVLRAEGVRTGLYTSPHLERYPERMELGGAVVSDALFAEAVTVALDAAERLRPGMLGDPEGFTEFELVTAAALWLFAREEVDIAVLEVGLGGGWDATSVVDPAVAVITGVGLDHMELLGDTLAKIAAEKAGIIKPASAPVLGPGTAGLEDAFLERAKQVRAHARAVRGVGVPSPVSEELTVRYHVTTPPDGRGRSTVFDCRGVHGAYPGLELRAPSYQAGNAAVAIAAAEAALGRALDPARVAEALSGARIPGRFEYVRVQPPVIIDGSHNPQAAVVLADAVGEMLGGYAPHVLIGVLDDKDAAGIVEALAPVAAGFSVTRPESPRALGVAQLAAVVEGVTGQAPTTFDTLAEALEALVDTREEPLLVTGSLTTAGQARAHVGSDTGHAASSAGEEAVTG